MTDSTFVSITRVFHASVHTLYHAWTEPSMLARWLLPGSNLPIDASIDVRIGGRFTIATLDQARATCTFSGVYTAVVPDTLLSMTWVYEGPSELLARSPSVLCVRFRKIGDDCAELVLEHAIIDEPLIESAYRLGWSTCLDKLDSTITTLVPQKPGYSYSSGQRAAQQRYESEELAATLREKLVRAFLSEENVAFVCSRDMLFLSTVDEGGVPTVSYKGGTPGFVRVDRGEIWFPSFDGNGMHLSIGNITTNSNVGLLFIDFETPQRLRVQGVATIDDGPARRLVPGADCLIRVAPTAVFANCARYIHNMVPRAHSKYVPHGDDPPPFPAWKRIDEIVPSLSQRDRTVAKRLGIIGIDDYTTLLENGQS